MTPDPEESSIVTLTRTVHDMLFGSALDEDARAIAQQIRDRNLAMLLPEQEWCQDCSRDIDAAAEPGMPQDQSSRCRCLLTGIPTGDPRRCMTSRTWPAGTPWPTWLLEQVGITGGAAFRAGFVT